MEERSLGEIIHEHRNMSGLTQNQLADLAGIGKTAVFDIEHGTKSPRFDTLQKICKVLNIKIKLESPLIRAVVKNEES
ncbi:MAG: XRE family transcriptional regulator [Proteobacteria bacterium]|nr:MAG: XRE family transcriptional regulator [Pseudomonadota bacterium]